MWSQDQTEYSQSICSSTSEPQWQELNLIVHILVRRKRKIPTLPLSLEKPGVPEVKPSNNVENLERHVSLSLGRI